MILREQLQQLRDLIHQTVARLRSLQQENAQLRQQAEQYQGNLSALRQENQALEQSQKAVEQELGQLLAELQGVRSEVTATMPPAFGTQDTSPPTSSLARPPATAQRRGEPTPPVPPPSLPQQEPEDSAAGSLADLDHAEDPGPNDVISSFVDTQTERSKTQTPAQLVPTKPTLREPTRDSKQENNKQAREHTDQEPAPDTEPSNQTPLLQESAEDFSHSLDLSLGLDGGGLLGLAEEMAAQPPDQSEQKGEQEGEHKDGQAAQELLEELEIF